MTETTSRRPWALWAVVAVGIVAGYALLLVGVFVNSGWLQIGGIIFMAGAYSLLWVPRG